MVDKQASIEWGERPSKRELGVLKSRFSVLQVLTLAGAISSTACQTSNEPVPQATTKQATTFYESAAKPSKARLPERTEKVEIEGNLKVGKVTHIRQFHKRPEFNDEQLLAVGEYQFKILQELESKHAKHVFVESLYEDFPPDHPERKKGMHSQVASLFPKGAPDKPSDLQKLFLATFGADRIYAYLNDDVYLHKTLTKEESIKIDSAISQNRPDAVTLMLDERERLASREVSNFLAKNPGAKVTLVYGGFHDFADDFSSDNPPQLVSVDFGPNHPQKKQESLELSLADIRKVEKIQDSEFQHIKDEETQLAALKKLELDHVFFKEFDTRYGGNLKTYLLDHAASDKVKAAIDKLLTS